MTTTDRPLTTSVTLKQLCKWCTTLSMAHWNLRQQLQSVTMSRSCDRYRPVYISSLYRYSRWPHERDRVACRHAIAVWNRFLPALIAPMYCWPTHYRRLRGGRITELIRILVGAQPSCTSCLTSLFQERYIKVTTLSGVSYASVYDSVDDDDGVQWFNVHLKAD